MTTLVVGATGATGRLLVRELLNHGVNVIALVRSPDKLPAEARSHPLLTVVTGTALTLGQAELEELVGRCDAVASCLGHNLTLKGMYGHPRRLVTDSVKRLCQAIKVGNRSQPTRLLLMNTAGNRHRGLNEPISLGEKIVVGLIRALVPPHPDNEEAAEYLRSVIGTEDSRIEWVAVRPDSLVDEDSPSDYTLHPSPTRSAIFNAGKTSRINVAHLMARLATDDDLWREWKGRMPVVYNRESDP